MEIVNGILFWIHLVALVGGGAAAVVMPIIGKQMPAATPETRAALLALGYQVSVAGRGAIGALIVTGPLLFWLKWNFSPSSMIWFGIKMALVVALLVGVSIAGINLKKAHSGDAAAAATARKVGRINGVLLLGIILAAVFAFA
jgi:protoporphyrinogen IX oxidase